MNNGLSKQVTRPATGSLFTITTVVPELKEIEKQLVAATGANGLVTGEIGNHLVLAGGKRIRPLLTILSGNHFRSPKDSLVTAGAAIELIHLASLVHDDIIDKAPVRRGQPSVNAKWGEKKAVLMGDYLFAKAFGLLAGQKLYAILQLAVDCIQEMCDGEIQQDKYKFNVNQHVNDYYRRIYQKTAKLLGACCQAGALLGRSEEREQSALSQYGLNLGYAFQIADDVLDITGQEATLGKPVGSDLIQGNLTLPVLLLLKDGRWGTWLAKKIARPEKLAACMPEIQAALASAGAIKAALARAYLHIKKAKEHLAGLNPSPHLGILESIADLVVSRNH